MERVLGDEKVISTRSAAASLGGAADRALGILSSGRRRLRRAIDRNHVAFISAEEELSSIEQRMAVYIEHAKGRRYAAYVNVGGSLVSIGPKSVKRLYRPGLNLRADPRGGGVDSVMMRFLRDDVPVINLSKVVPLAEAYGLPIEPSELPPVGEGPVFERHEHNRLLVVGLLFGLLAALYGLLKLEFGARITALSGRSQGLKPMA
jgi:poly-gamma-glutamate system protein